MSIDYANRLTDDSSITMRHTLASFPFFYSFFYQSPLSLWRFPCRTKERSSGSAELFQPLSKRHCPVYRAYSYAVHRCIRRYSVAIPPSYSFPYPPNPLAPRSSTSVIVTEAHWTLSTIPAIARVVDAPTLDCRYGTTRPLRMQRMPRVRTCVHVACAFRMRTQSTAAYSLTHPTQSAVVRFPHESDGLECWCIILVGVIDDRNKWIFCQRFCRRCLYDTRYYFSH